MTDGAALPIPFSGMLRQYESIRTEILEVTDRVYNSGCLLDGRFVCDLENRMSQVTGRKFCIAVGSGTMALFFALSALRKESNNSRRKIIVPAQSFTSTVNTVIESGFEPVFCDVDPTSGLIDISKIPVNAGDIAGVVAVNLFGNMPDYDSITAYATFFSENRIPIIEDASQSLGSSYKGRASGSFGEVSCFSFGPNENLANYGSGGMVLTDNEQIAEVCRNMRNDGKESAHALTGLNSKLSEVDAAQLLVKIEYFDDWQVRREFVADQYTTSLGQYVTVPSVDDNVTHSWSRFVIHTPVRDKLADFLAGRQIETRIHYDLPVHLQPVSLVYNNGFLISSEDFSASCISLPIYPEITNAEISRITEAISGYIKG